MEAATQVNFVYLGPSGEEVLDRQFQARCVALPRIGEFVMPLRGSARLIVTEVYYKLIESTTSPGELLAIPTVVLEEVPE